MSKLVIISPSLKLGGIERALTVLTHEFVKKGVEVHFISCLKGTHFYKLPQTVEIYEPPFKRTNSSINKVLYYPRLLQYLRKKVKSIHPDRVLVFGDWFSPLSLLALLHTSYPVYISDRTIPNYKFKFPIPQLKNWLYPKSAGYIAQTQRAKVFKEQAFNKRLNIQVIPNALPKFDKIDMVERENIIAYVGRFAWEKDPEILIRAMVPIKNKHPKWELHLAGTGPLCPKMKELAKELGVDQQIEFLGQLPQVEQLYQKASIFVLPSVVEGFPNALIEAMSFGLPCICFSDIPYEDIVEDQRNALLITERSPKLLAENIIQLIEDKNLRSRLGQEALEINHTLKASTVADQFLKFMQIQ